MPIGSGTSTPCRLSEIPENSPTRKYFVRKLGKPRLENREMAFRHGEHMRRLFEHGGGDRAAHESFERRAAFPQDREGFRAHGSALGRGHARRTDGEIIATGDDLPRTRPSAIGLRQVFPVQTKSTCLWSDIAADSGERVGRRQTAMAGRIHRRWFRAGRSDPAVRSSVGSFWPLSQWS